MEFQKVEMFNRYKSKELQQRNSLIYKEINTIWLLLLLANRGTYSYIHTFHIEPFSYEHKSI